jgi:hypothetical protein
MAGRSSRRHRIIGPGLQAQLKTGQHVSATQLRQIYASARIEARETAGDLVKRPGKFVHLGKDRGEIPACSHSGRIAFRDLKNEKHAEVHCYILPDGSIGGSGLLDPKEVRYNGVLYFYDRQ